MMATKWYDDEIWLNEITLQERLFREFFKDIKTFNCIVSMDGYFIYFSPRWSHKLMIPDEQIRKTQFKDFIHPEDLEWTMDIWEKRRSSNSRDDVMDAVNRYQGNGEVFYVRWVTESLDSDNAYMFCHAVEATKEDYERFRASVR